MLRVPFDGASTGVYESDVVFHLSVTRFHKDGMLRELQELFTLRAENDFSWRAQRCGVYQLPVFILESCWGWWFAGCRLTQFGIKKKQTVTLLVLSLWAYLFQERKRGLLV